MKPAAARSSDQLERIEPANARGADDADDADSAANGEGVGGGLAAVERGVAGVPPRGVPPSPSQRRLSVSLIESAGGATGVAGAGDPPRALLLAHASPGLCAAAVARAELLGISSARSHATPPV